MKLSCYILDAFTGTVFGGNPAAVCPLDEWLDDALLQNIASENNLAETAFFVPDGEEYHLRWFTPTNEVELCGHATLASAKIIFDRRAPGKKQIRFRTLGGMLGVTREGDLLSLDFPSRPPDPIEEEREIIDALGASPTGMWKARDHLALFDSEATIRNLQPDMRRLSQVEMFALIVTAPGENSDFVSRFFAPAQGIDEDPVTGSAHCTLIPFWAGRLGRSQLYARQVSKRGGELFCKLLGDRVGISGRVALYADSVLHV
jgi:PhzF family phenazine biosynthesis protein